MNSPDIAYRFWPNQQGELPNTVRVSAVPVGSVLPWATPTPPAGYLRCDGTQYSTTAFSDLFQTIGYTFGGVSGEFNVPNLTARQIFGFDGGSVNPYFASFSAIGNVSGATRYDMSGANLPEHNHYVKLGTAYTVPPDGQPFPVPATINTPTTATQTNTDVYNTSGTIVTQQALKVLQPYLTLEFIIKY